ncbi:hypothetical protein OZX58_03380 [Lactobacillus sp. ESL0680]|uniref:hypothetical protein n=1 Tax=Lactobacillus sp. ESL0680 TaxID=2983210 RepID=UPI0023F63C74|nr:hypothetical protein [Lactobacillus sp. ESL0680]WEV39292.1 hypothetical protein OZX58_03380 [Lactobacillus sp. ESL0680]
MLIYNGKARSHLYLGGRKLVEENFLPRYYKLGNSGNSDSKIYSLDVSTGNFILNQLQLHFTSIYGGYKSALVYQIINYNGDDYALLDVVINGYDEYPAWIRLKDFGGATPL